MIVTVTFHCADNYGAVWQAFALQSYIKSAFPKQDVACLDYKPKYLQAKLFHFDNNESLIKSLAKNVLTLPSRLERILRFRKFRKKILIQFLLKASVLLMLLILYSLWVATKYGIKKLQIIGWTQFSF